jgi:hypothetical protein
MPGKTSWKKARARGMVGYELNKTMTKVDISKLFKQVEVTTYSQIKRYKESLNESKTKVCDMAIND